MAKGSTKIAGIVESWRSAKEHDAFRIGYYKNDKQVMISAKIHPVLKEANSYLEARKLRKEFAIQDSVFNGLRRKLHESLKSEHGLKEYRIREQLELKKKGFNFEQSLEEFVAVKAEYCSTGHNQMRIIKNIWLPFFFSQGCEHPSEFNKYLVNAKRHLRVARNKNGELYARDSLISICSALNEYMRIVTEYGYIDEKDTFTILMPRTVKKQRGGTAQRKKRPIYTFEEVHSIKEKIDAFYPEGSLWKRRAYGIYLGVCTGLRNGNIRGLKPKNLFPDANPPHFETGDNVVSGASRGLSGTLVLEFQTKTFEGTVKIPFIQPDVPTLVAVARYLKQNVPEDEHILQCFPTTIAKWWKKIARECGFRWVNPHNFKHGYATRGAHNLQNLYRSNPHFLQWCCLHSSYDTTQRYIDEVGGALLDAFRQPSAP